VAGCSSFVYGPHLQRSTDGGETWQPVEGSPKFSDGSPRRLQQLWSFTRTRDGDRYYCGVAEAALFSSGSIDGPWEMNTGLEGHPTRERWSPGAGGLCLHTIIEDATNPDRLFVAISAVGVLRSDDGGRTWELKNKDVVPADPEMAAQFGDNCCCHKLVQDPTNPDTLYQQNHVGVFRSHDAGENWERIESGLPANFGFPMVMHPRDPRTLYVIPQESSESRWFVNGQLGVYRSTDGGDSWHPIGKGLEEDNYNGVLRDGLAVDSRDPAGIYFGTTGGELFVSADEGETWRLLPGHFPRILNVKVA
jgi:photosystem II stability/assembly factor-like uncharacterized protein